MSGILNASCCCGGGTIPPGNTVCVPVVGTSTPTFTITASQAGWVRGEPKGLSSTLDCPTDNCGTPSEPSYIYCALKIWAGWNNAVGSFEGKYYRDGWRRNDSPNCECCEITEDTLTYTGGSWTATMQFGGGANTVNVLSESNTFVSGGVSGVKYLCSAIDGGSGCTLCPTCCGGASGLYDIIVVTFGGYNETGPYHPVQATDENGAALCDPPYDSAYVNTYSYGYSADVYFYKPVPFTATRTLTGVYTRFASRVTVPLNFYQTFSSFGGPWNSLGYALPYPGATVCDVITTGAPDNPAECLCGSANGFGFTFPSTITLT